jgi:hypothetical protein
MTPESQLIPCAPEEAPVEPNDAPSGAWVPVFSLGTPTLRITNHDCSSSNRNSNRSTQQAAPDEAPED